MTETSYHLGLKKIAREILENQGLFVEEEYKIRISGKNYIVDVVGLACSKRKVAIECGQTSFEKIEKLKTVFEEVRVLDLQEAMEYFEKKADPHDVQTIKNKLEVYQRAYARVKCELEELKRKWDAISEIKASKEKKEKLLQVRCTESTLTWFRKFCVNNHFQSQEAALQDLLKLGEIREDVIRSAEEVLAKTDISVEKFNP